ncbi:MAG: cation-translocating P-type ATPase [bacterium]|nr:cation-translocating P-type ATPase [bacterium]
MTNDQGSTADNAARAIRGLTQAEAEARLQAEGYNELPNALHRSAFAIVLEVVREPMFLLLVAAGLIYLLLGDVGEAAVLLSFVLVVMGITIYQEQRTEHVLEALRDLTSPRALVIRDGEERRIAGREVVRGDILLLAEGDRVAADAAVLSASNLQLDESLLTGESVPVSKICREGDEAITPPGGEGLAFVYSGTLVVQGQAMAEVLATGARSEIGHIGTALQTVTTESSPLQQQTRKLVRNLAIISLSLCLLLLVVFGLTRGDWIGGLLAGITLAMATLPEEFPVILTVFMALGAWRISQKRVLTRRVPAIETLGAATVLCVDKTGTLTQNRMTVHTIVAADEFFRVPDEKNTAPLAEEFHELLEFGILASDINPFDPMEKAIRALGDRYLASTEHLHNDWSLLHEYPLTREMRAISHVWKSTRSEDHVVAAKGAPEAIVDLCHLDAATAAAIAQRVDTLSGQGLRVLGVAQARFGGEDWPPIQHDFSFEFLGLVALADPLRPAVPAALRECRAAGIRVVMITGDYPGTALAIAREAGLEGSEVMTGAELDQLSATELGARLRTVNVFARVVPDQKLKLVQALKANGEIVAMTGDGVNDAPALKAAHIGIAMGGRGTDVAREAASLVLLDDDFTSIVEAVRLGRRIYDNLRKAMTYILAIHVPIAGLSLLPVFFGWPLVFFPIHIAFLQLIIDPVCSIVFEAEKEEPDTMRRPPRRADEALFGGWNLGISLLQGAGVLLLSMTVFGIALSQHLGEGEARALAFITLVVANIALIFTNRVRHLTLLASLRIPNPSLWLITGAAALCLGAILAFPLTRELFRFALPDRGALILAVVAGLAGIVWFELFKLFHLPGKGPKARPSPP